MLLMDPIGNRNLEKIWEKSELIKNQETSSYQYLKKYFLYARGIKEDNFNDLLEVGLFRLNEYQDKKQIIHPILTPKESSSFSNTMASKFPKIVGNCALTEGLTKVSRESRY